MQHLFVPRASSIAHPGPNDAFSVCLMAFEWQVPDNFLNKRGGFLFLAVSNQRCFFV